MVSLLDIAPLAKTVEVRGKELTVTGITALGLAQLINRFPEIRKLMTDRSEEGTNPAAIMAMVPEIIAAVVAAGTGMPGNPEAEKVVLTSLGVGDQATLVGAIWRETFPRGLGPFVQEIEGLGLAAATAVASDDSGRAPDTKSPSQSNGSSQPATAKASPGP